ncbi:hypothetical protein B0H13DRAFT_2353499 [Mycena leptocephala]|nr:hypothetical protein B0H13DRAFT_2353499 [Mycena leptocephala]
MASHSMRYAILMHIGTSSIVHDGAFHVALRLLLVCDGVSSLCAMKLLSRARRFLFHACLLALESAVCFLSSHVSDAPWTHSVRDGASFSCANAFFFIVCEALWTHSVRHGASFIARISVLLSWAMVPSFPRVRAPSSIVRDGAFLYRAKWRPPLIQCATVPYSCARRARPPLSHATAPSSIVRDGASPLIRCATAPSSIERDAAPPIQCATAPHSCARRRPSIVRDSTLLSCATAPSSIVHDGALLSFSAQRRLIQCATAPHSRARRRVFYIFLCVHHCPHSCVRRGKNKISSSPTLGPYIAPHAIEYSSSTPRRYAPRCTGDLPRLELFSFIHAQRRTPFHFFSCVMAPSFIVCDRILLFMHDDALISRVFRLLVTARSSRTFLSALDSVFLGVSCRPSAWARLRFAREASSFPLVPETLAFSPHASIPFVRVHEASFPSSSRPQSLLRHDDTVLIARGPCARPTLFIHWVLVLHAPSVTSPFPDSGVFDAHILAHVSRASRPSRWHLSHLIHGRASFLFSCARGTMVPCYSCALAPSIPFPMHAWLFPPFMHDHAYPVSHYLVHQHQHLPSFTAMTLFRGLTLFVVALGT